ncbi:MULTISPECIES: DMT family transporter [unclassified Helicobacter]|uniref:DMT family transporter n=1 Tax=unclassified Helicobacter TaxID=2593540 RepID=UPI000CF08BBA|nr:MULTISPECIES: DMT family transporter [unclassified Helicobacter]
MQNQLKFFFFAILAESFIIYASVLVKIIDIKPIMLGFYRVALAIPVFLFFARKSLLKVSLKDCLLMILAGIFFGLDLVFFNTALHHTSVAHVNLISSLVCFILVPIGIIFFKEEIQISFVLGAGITLIGIFLLLGGKDSNSVSSLFGDFLAFISMCCYSIFLALVYKMRKTYGAMLLMVFSCVGSSILLLGTGTILEGFQAPMHLKDWLLVLLVVMFGQILGQGFFGYIMGKLDTQTSSLTLLLSPIIATILGYLFLKETINVYEMIGILLIIFGAFIAKR